MKNDKQEGDNETFSLVEEEHKVLQFWQREQIFRKSLEKTRAGKPYVFYDGPPFATGLPHHGHLVGSVLKDIVPRYFTMKGRYVERRFGWDCHGLPIEHEIDKSLGMSAQEAVSQMGVKGYNDECRKIVQRYTKEWKKTITRVGRWVDFDNDYKTMDADYMESVWWVLKQLWEKNLVYRGVKIVPVSTELGTVLSNFEAGSNYKDVQDPAVTVLFKLLEEEGYLAAWTTTPWTLPANLGLCVGEDIDYVKVRDNTNNLLLVVAEARLADIVGKNDVTIIDSFKGKELVGKRYHPLFPYFSELENEGAFCVLSDDYVKTDNGTGIVHLAPAFGEDDFRIFKKIKVAPVCPVDMNGRFTEQVPEYQGMVVKDADKIIIKRLKQEGHLYQHQTIEHSYPFCPRSDTPLIYRAVPSWYVKVEQMRDELVAANQQINWQPNYLKQGRMENWLAGAVDWAISRNRYWGTPIPIWVNDLSGKTICIGSKDELFALSGERVDDLHRENVDNLEFSIAGEEGVYRRVSEVLDCWFESGSMPYAQQHYPFENKRLFENGFPAEFIAEGLDQTRGWFYTLTVLSVALFGKPAFKNVVVNGIVLAADGKKMSKRLKNYTAPDELLEKYGADALRLYFMNTGLVKAEELRFENHDVKDMARSLLLPWLNAVKFLKTYAQIDHWQVLEDFKESDNIVDRWITSKLQTLKFELSEAMEQYQLCRVVPRLLAFVEDLTNWYVRLNRQRFWQQDMTEDKMTAYNTLYRTLLEFTQCMAPFAPFLSETLYQSLSELKATRNEESVHLCDYPESIDEQLDTTLEDAFERVQHIILLGRKRRNQVKIKTKIPLKSITVIHRDPHLLQGIKRLENYIKLELNIKEVKYSTEEERFVKFYAQANLKLLGKRFGKKLPYFRTKIESLSPRELSLFEESGQLTIDEETFSLDDIIVLREPEESTGTLTNRFISVALDCSLEQSQLDEGLAREFVNRIQRTRKELGFNVTDRIAVHYKAANGLAHAIKQHLDYIMKETLCDELLDDGLLIDGLGELNFCFELGGERVMFSVVRL